MLFRQVFVHTGLTLLFLLSANPHHHPPKPSDGGTTAKGGSSSGGSGGGGGGTVSSDAAPAGPNKHTGLLGLAAAAMAVGTAIAFAATRRRVSRWKLLVLLNVFFWILSSHILVHAFTHVCSRPL